MDVRSFLALGNAMGYLLGRTDYTRICYERDYLLDKLDLMQGLMSILVYLLYMYMYLSDTKQLSK